LHNEYSFFGGGERRQNGEKNLPEGGRSAERKRETRKIGAFLWSGIISVTPEEREKKNKRGEGKKRSGSEQITENNWTEPLWGNASIGKSQRGRAGRRGAKKEETP